MNVSVNKVRWQGDRILVEVLPEEQHGKIYLPTKKDPTNEDRRCWRGKVTDFGADVDAKKLAQEGVEKGAVVYIRPMSYHCPTFTDQGKTYKTVIPDDLFMVEA